MLRKFLLIAIFIVVFITADIAWTYRSFLLHPPSQVFYRPPKTTFWDFQSIDTMKYSRDIAREKEEDADFDAVIDRQVEAIADTGATHVAIATPYDEEFIPFMRRWVDAARRYHLKVWFRGNFSGWEGWFEYPRISMDEHVTKTREFIVNHQDLFEDGDVFSSCPECENGGPGDPRQTGKVNEYRRFLVSEYIVAKDAFNQIHKDVETNFFSMNGDVARLVMDDVMSMRLGGYITIDHYVDTPERLLNDAEGFSRSGKRNIILGEFGVPIPDIHGPMTEEEQAVWVHTLLSQAVHKPYIKGMNYWLSVGGSTQLWDSKGNERQAVSALRNYFSPKITHGFVHDALGWPVAGATIKAGEWQTETDGNGHFSLLFPEDVTDPIIVSADGYEQKSIVPNSDEKRLEAQEIILSQTHASWKYKVLYWFKHLGK